MSRTLKTRWTLPVLGLVALILAGCGQSSPQSSSAVPLISGAQVVQQVKRCDEGSSPFCAVDLVVADPDHRYASSDLFLKHERTHLRQLGWSLQAGEIGQEHSAVSPGQKYRIVYATAAGDLLALDLGWIQRPSQIGPALSKTLFDRVPAISLMVEAGPS
jgi:hypothetical protein